MKGASQVIYIRMKGNDKAYNPFESKSFLQSLLPQDFQMSKNQRFDVPASLLSFTHGTPFII